MKTRSKILQKQIDEELKYAMQHSNNLPDPKAERALENIEEIKRDLQRIREAERRDRFWSVIEFAIQIFIDPFEVYLSQEF